MENVPDIEFIDSSFQSHEFSFIFCDMDVKCGILKMRDSYFMWIGDSKNPQLSDLSFGIKSQYDSQSIATKILGTASADITSQSMAMRLNQKLKKPIFISFNLSISNNRLLEEIEKRINEEIEMNPAMF